MKLLSAILLLTSSAFAATFNVNPSSNIQSVINSAAVGDTVAFAAGTYPQTLTFKPGVTYTGPSATPATAIISGGASATASATVQYFNFAKNGIYVQPNAAGLTFQHNQFSSLTGEGITFSGDITSTLANVDIEYNTFGDASSCSAVFASVVDAGGYCAGFSTHVGLVTNLTVKHNSFVHVEEGLHLNALGNYVVGAKGAVCDNCDIEYNYFLNNHRISAEIQLGVINHPVIFSHNVIQDPLNAYYGSYALSVPCCQWGATLATASNVAQALLVQDNVMISSVSATASPYGIEFWGNGSLADHNIIQGNYCNGVTFGYGDGSWAITNNVIQGPTMAPNGCGGYITNEEHQVNDPLQSGNVTGPLSAAQTTIAPTIQAVNGLVTITMPNSASNSTIHYTTDGSTPTTASSIYTKPFQFNGTVKAIAMWGSSPQPLSYPAGYGYVPSVVVTAQSVVPVAPSQPTPPTVITLPAGTYTMTVPAGVTLTKVGP